VLASAKNAQLSVRDVGAALAVLGDNARVGSIAGNTLTRTFNLMLAPSGAATKALATIGLKQASLANDMASPGGLVKALTDLKSHLKSSGLTAVQQAQVIAEAFGRSRGSTYVELLVQQLERLKNKEKEVGAGGKGFASSWAGYTKTFQYAWDKMRAAVQKMAIELGTKLLPTATRVINWISGHTKVLLVAAGAWAAFKVGARLATIAMAQFDVAAAANPVGLIVLALEAVTAAFIIAYEKSETFRKIVKRVFVDLATGVGYWAKYNLLALRYVADAMLNFVGMALHAAASLASFLPFGIGNGVKAAAHKFDEFRASTVSTLTNLANDAGRLGADAGSLFASGFESRAQIFSSSAKYYVKGKNLSGLKGLAGALGQSTSTSSPTLTLPGGGTTGGGAGAVASAANVLHITASHLTKAIASGLLNGWQGFSQTVKDSLSTGTRNLLDQLQKQFKTVTDGMAKLVKDARTRLANDLKAQTQFVQQMMSDAALSNVPTTASGYLANGGQRLTNIGGFLGGQAQSYAAFARALKRLSHMGLAKGLFNQIAAMGPTAGLQYAQQILANPGMIGQLNAYNKQIQSSAKAIGQDRYGSQITADRRDLRRQTHLQEQMERHLAHLAQDIGREVAKNAGGATITLNGKTVGLTPHEVQQLLKDIDRYKRRMRK
jgi:phage-related protein